MFPNFRFQFPSLLYDISNYTLHNNVLSIIHNNACSLFWQSLSLTPGPWRQFPASLFLLLLVLFLLLVVARGNAPLAVSSRHLSVLPATLLPSAYLTSKNPPLMAEDLRRSSRSVKPRRSPDFVYELDSVSYLATLRNASGEDQQRRISSSGGYQQRRKSSESAQSLASESPSINVVIMHRFKTLLQYKHETPNQSTSRRRVLYWVECLYCNNVLNICIITIL